MIAKPEMVMEIKIILKKDVEIILSLDDARQLHAELDKLFGRNPLQYQPGVVENNPYPHPTKEQIAEMREIYKLQHTERDR